MLEVEEQQAERRRSTEQKKEVEKEEKMETERTPADVESGGTGRTFIKARLFRALQFREVWGGEYLVGVVGVKEEEEEEEKEEEGEPGLNCTPCSCPRRGSHHRFIPLSTSCPGARRLCLLVSVRP
ncbi:hypothetical protein CRUP_028659 [Coryphaenoides rupestris]|nr:hypothetical protein CRUP_028659 [Coryphaenoides rupestris]